MNLFKSLFKLKNGPYFDELDKHLKDFVKNNPLAIIHFREMRASDGLYRIFLQIQDDSNDSWREKTDISDINLQCVFGEEIIVCLGNQRDFVIYKQAMKGTWKTYAFNSLFQT